MKYRFYFYYDNLVILLNKDTGFMHQYTRSYLRFPYSSVVDDDLDMDGVDYMQYYSWCSTDFTERNLLSLHLRRR